MRRRSTLEPADVPISGCAPSDRGSGGDRLQRVDHREWLPLHPEGIEGSHVHGVAEIHSYHRERAVGLDLEVAPGGA